MQPSIVAGVRGRSGVASLALLLVLSCGRPSAGPGPSSRVFVIGLDAADWHLLDPLMEAGQLPSIKRLVDNGTRAGLRTLSPTLSPTIWNSIATGKTVEKHGITGFADTIDGQYRVFTSNLLRARPVWALLNEGGVTTNVFGWWTTWPAQKLDGRLVSSYASLNQRSWKGTIVDDVPSQTYPEELFDEIAPIRRRVREAAGEGSERIFGRVDPSQHNAATLSNVRDTQWSLLADALFHQTAMHVQRKYPASFFTVYLGGIDVIGHRFWKYMDPTAFAEYDVTESERRQFGDAIREYYRLVDEYVGEYMTLADESTTFVIVSDHGMRACPLSSNPYIAERSGAHDRAEEGVVILSGMNVRKGHALAEVPSVFDIAPTVLYLMGLPVDSEMDGRVILGAIESEYRKLMPVAQKRYEPRRRGDEEFVTSEHDEELLERLRALGYLR